MSKRWFMAPVAGLAMLITVAVLGSGSVAAANPVLKLKAGDGEPGYAVNQFFPSSVTIATGDTVEWTFGWLEVHHIALVEGTPPDEEPAPSASPATFPNEKKLVFSGDIVGDPASPTLFAIKFTKAGTYDYHCFIHEGMDGTVKVVDPGSAGSGGIDNQFSVDARSKAQYAGGIQAIKDIGAGIKAGADLPKPNGGKTVEAVLGNYTPGLGQVQAFVPRALNIREGDSVKWVSRDGAPHNVVFGAPAQADPFAFPGAKSGSVYDGTGSLQSPIIALEGFGPDTPKSYEVVFSKAGTYNYICLLHADQGMVGQVVVASRGATAPGAPNTGSGLASDGGSNSGWYLVAGALAIVTLLAGATAVHARR